jgi:hypothetical protein
MVDAVDALINGQAPDEEQAEDVTEPLQLTITGLAQHLDISPEELYKLEVTTGGGEKVSLSALKDAWQDRQGSARETAKREAALDERESALTAEAMLFQQLGGELAKAVSPQMRQALVQKAQQQQAKQREMMLTAMPELRDQAKFENFRSDLVKMLGTYGFRPQEMTVSDHRMLLLMRDHMRVKARLDQLLSFDPSQTPPKAQKAGGRADGQSQKKAMVTRAKASRHDSDKVEAIAKLIGA